MGDPKELDEFISKAYRKYPDYETHLSFENFFPSPPELSEQEFLIFDPEITDKNLKKYGYPDLYRWRTTNWGTKWDVEAKVLRAGDNEATYDFDSPWGPPLDFLVNVSSLYPNLKYVIRYMEPNMSFIGAAVIENGEANDECREMTNDEFDKLFGVV